MMCIRAATNNRPDEPETDGIVVLTILSIRTDGQTGDIVVSYIDAACDNGELRILFGQMLQVYH